MVIFEPGMKAVKYGNLVSPLIESTKQLYGMCRMSQKQLQSIQLKQSQTDDEIEKLKEQMQMLIDENRQIKERLRELETSGDE